MIPDSWDKVNFSQFLRIKPGMRLTELLAILLEKPEAEVMTLKLDLDAALKKLDFLNDTVPQTGGEWLTDHELTNLEMEWTGRYIDFREYAKLMKGTAEDFAHYPVMFATYWQRPYNSDTVDGLIKYVNQKPCGLVLGVVQWLFKEMERIETAWRPKFPSSGYTSEQTAAGFPQIADYFGEYCSLILAERNSQWSRDEWTQRPLGEFKHFMLYLAREQEAQKKYSEGQAAKVRQQSARRR